MKSTWERLFRRIEFLEGDYRHIYGSPPPFDHYSPDARRGYLVGFIAGLLEAKKIIEFEGQMDELRKNAKIVRRIAKKITRKK